MADRFGINQEIIVVPEVVYGAQVTIFSSEFMTKHQNLTFNYEPGVQPINTVIRNSSLVKSSCEDKAGRKMPTVTISGDLTLQNASWLFKGLVLDTAATSPFKIAGQQNNYSYQFLQYDTVTDTANIFTGCTMETLTLTREADKWTFTANYRAKEIKRDVDLSAWTGDEPVAVCEDQALFLNTNWLGGSVVSVTGFTFTFTNTFVDDDTIFLNSATRAKEVVTGTTGAVELSYIVTAGTSYTADILDSGEDKTIVSTIAIGSSYINISMPVLRLINSTEPDPERNRFIGNLSLEMVDDGTNEPLTVAIT